ncbi:MAG TPA: hypothetical protein VHM92_12705 [Allosphingosinicella sp.]|nr:hypothetical protein [Allosphingosinicella sp.]
MARWAKGAASLALALATACARPEPSPAYPAPTLDEARLAYGAALEAAWVQPGDPNEPPPEGRDEGYFEAMARGGRIARAEAAIENNERIRSSIETLAQAAPSGCEWKPLDLADATDGAEANRAGYPASAWHCTLRVVHDTPALGPVAATTDGWLFRERGAFVYVGKAAHGFKPVAPRPAP